MVKKFGWSLVFAVLASSCLDEPECYSLNNDMVGISFKKMSDGATDTIFFNRISVEGTDIIFVPEDDFFPSTIDLPLNYYENQTIYNFEGPYGNHRIQFDYTVQAQFVSEDCGERFVLTRLTATSETFDSLRLLGAIPKRDRQAGTHLEIYRCPNMSRVKIRILPADAEVVLINGDSAISSGGANVFTIPLDVASDQSTIQFGFANGATRDLILSYSRNESTLFDVCGSQVVLSALDTVSTTFSSTRILNKTIRDPLLTNFEVTF